jgi:hypothetical protein
LDRPLTDEPAATRYNNFREFSDQKEAVSIEDCFALNKRSDRSAILAGWREMNDYMAERQLAPLAPIGASPVASAQPVGDGVPTATAREPAAAASAVPAARASKPAARADG